MVARHAAELVALDLPAGSAASAEASLANWLEARLADFAAAACVAGVDPNDPTYRRTWGRDADAIHADLRTVGLVPRAWDCVEVATSDVRWRRTWSGGAFEGRSRFCDRHHDELQAGAAWAAGDEHLVYLAQDVAAPTALGSRTDGSTADASDPDLGSSLGQLDLLSAGAPAGAMR